MCKPGTRRAADLYPTKTEERRFSEVLEKKGKAVAWVLIKAECVFPVQSRDRRFVVGSAAQHQAFCIAGLGLFGMWVVDKEYFIDRYEKFNDHLENLQSHKARRHQRGRVVGSRVSSNASELLGPPRE